ncbi:mitofusin NDAI_0C05690 [Naumovozyma dairenensis CBS 421]|uniref:Dynamin-type G domain-containing protein n=1 Tax=Naumovozyma dairenensis (strain ATCC 10597 / BCRC 20456 / CBS 421 / NBRC 0211 / NRRL Y-12639) TaxID=1071378 RepID=G0W8W7_NAUDC|nr:hypothetical protein NDAI_0C05690 [Naumovozyma dairenensis CBS 421]CCD24228.1 hypothetical protein NDAI_0C05690 [Naumovozyma dairenensis CBS 421]
MSQNTKITVDNKQEKETDDEHQSWPGHNDDALDDNTTLAPSTISYSRNDGTFTTNANDNETLCENTATSWQRGTGHLPQTMSRSKDKMISSQLSQWNYNHNKTMLKRGILQTRDILHELEDENDTRPIFVIHNDPRNKTGENQLHILNLHVKLDGNYSRKDQKDSFGLDKQSISRLFKSQVEKALNHLGSLDKRVDDVSSKVFITGDVNTGKSTFCNSLLKKHVLPEDQLPCTNVFCEILEARENSNIEEVHAILLSQAPTVKDANVVYNIKNRTTYEIYPLNELSELVEKSDRYSLLKVYIKDDKRPAEQSLLRNGTVDISLIDSPGLNMDSIQTAEVMARQEEIDLVIFVVNAENQLTLSAKEFITLASREKKLMFFVVKKFDKIKDKDRCKKLILKQIQELSPETYKSANEFIHFISSYDDENIPSSGQGGDPNDSDNDNDSDIDDFPNNNDPDFDHLEDSLRNFVLKRRSMSKLLPAKTFICKLLSDVETLSSSNMKIYQDEQNEIKKKLKELEPELVEAKSHCNNVTLNVDKLVEDVVNETYEYTNNAISQCLIISPEKYPKYQGLSKIYDFIFATEQFIKNQIIQSVERSESFAIKRTEESVQNINNLGKQQLGDDFMSNRQFNSELMFTRRSDVTIRQLSSPLHIVDLFAPSWESFIHYLSWGLFNGRPQIETIENKQSDMNSKGTLSTALGLKDYPLVQYWTKPSLLFTSKVPALVVYSFGGAKIVGNLIINGITTFSWRTLGQVSGSILVITSLLGVAYFIHDLPRALPLNISSKYKTKLENLDYIRNNSDRISKEVRNVLKIPTREILRSCQLVMDKKEGNKRELERTQEDNKISYNFFHKLSERATSQRAIVESINLEVD